MSWLDIALIVVGLLVLWWGMSMGLIKAAFLALGIVVGLILAGQISEGLASRFAGDVKNESVVAAIAYAIVFGAIIFAAMIAGSIVRKVFNLLFLGWLDRLAGLVLGALAGFLLGFALIAVLARLAFLVPQHIPGAAVPVEARKSIERSLLDSALVPYYLRFYDTMPASALGMVPGDYKTALDALEARRGLRRPLAVHLAATPMTPATLLGERGAEGED